MKRKFTTFVITMCMMLPVFGQQPAIDFSGLNNPNWIPSGILFENNPDFWTLNPNFHPLNYDGVRDSVCDRNIFIGLYDFFYYASFTRPNTTLPIISDSLAADIYRSDRNPPVRLGLMEFSYQALSESALAEGIIGWDTINFVAFMRDSLVIYDTIYDLDTSVVPPDTIGIIDILETVIYFDPDSLADLAFDTYNVFAMAAFNDRIDLDSANQPITFSLESIYHFHDQSGFGSYEISIDGGNTYIPIQVNTPLTIPNHNLGTGTHLIKFRRGNTVESPISTFKLEIIVAFNTPDYQVSEFSEVQCPDLDFSAGVGSGVATFFINDLNQGKLKKPVIIVEGLDGMDISLAINNEKDRRYVNNSGLIKYGAYDYLSFFSGANSISNATNPFQRADSLDKFLRSDHDYDIIYLDFETSRTNLRKNANYLIQLIQYVNAELEANQSNEQIAIMGIGTGGVVARIALREMELQYCCHNTRMLTTFDAPHRGFNVPLGLQHFMKSTTSEFDLKRFERIRKFYETIVQSPMFSELMIYNIDNTKAAIHQNFQNYLDDIGMPQACRNFAVSNGNDQGLPQHIRNSVFNEIQPGDTIFDFKVKYYAPIALPSTTSDITALITIGLLAGSLNKDFYMARAIPFIADEGPYNSVLLYKRGRSYNANLNQLIAHYAILTGAIWGLKTISIKAVAAIGKAIAASQPWFVPVIKFAEKYASEIYTAAVTAILVANKQNNNSYNEGSKMIEAKNTQYILSYDIAPGGFYDFPQHLNRISSNSIDDLKRPQQSFVPVLSALNIDSAALYMKIDDNATNLIRDGILPFEDYHSAYSASYTNYKNELHGLLTLGDNEVPGNIPWFVDKLINTHSPSAPSPQSVIVLQGETLNYGIPHGSTLAPEDKLRNMDVLAHGKAAINSLDNVGFPVQQLNAPTSGSSFSITTQAPECGGTYCTVDSLGLFQVGEFVSSSPASSTTANVIFLENSTLEIKSGGKLVIERNSSLVIEEGATLIIHPGAEIYLNDATAILEIKGKVEVKDNAIFTFTSQNPINYGHIIFNQRQWVDGNEVPVTEYWEIGDNAQFVLEGAHAQGNVLMECKSNFRTSTGSLPKFSLLKLKNGAVQISENHNANLTADSVYMEGVLVDDNGLGAIKHNGIQFWGMNNQTAEIKTSVFKNGYHCVNAYQIGSQLPLRFDSCSFENNDTSLVVYNGAFEVLNCDFSTSELGIYTKNALKTSRIHHSIFELIEAVRVEGDESADLRIHESQFVSNTTPNHKEGVAINSFYVDVSSTCSEFTQYEKAIIANDCMIDLSELAVNHFTENDTAILLRFADGVNLYNGENRFTSNGFDVIGIVNDLSLSPTININGSLHINARHNNKMFIDSIFSNQPLSGHVLNASSNSALLLLHSPTSGFFVQMCENAQGYEPINPFEPAMNGVSHISINVDVLGNTYNFIDALLLVTNDVYGNEEYEAYLLDAISNLQSIIAQVDEEINASMSEDVKMAYIIALKMNMDLLRMAYDAH